MNDRFRIYGLMDIPEIDLEKSIAGEGGDHGPDYKDYIVKGRVLNSVKDDQGQTPIIPEMDWSYFDEHGFVKYEHDPVEMTIDKAGNKIIKGQPAHPGNIIGAPIRRIRKSDSEEYLEAGLFPDMDKAQDVVKLIKSIREWNKRYPHRKRTLGYSIEGQYIKKSKTSGKYAGKVVNVVITPNPRDYTSDLDFSDTTGKVVKKSIDISSYSEFMQVSNLSLAKSLTSGYETDSAQKTGGESFRKESLEKRKQNLTFTSNNKGENKMDTTTFVSEHDAYWHARGQGQSEEDAKKYAREYMEAVNKKRGDRKGKAEKSMQGALEHFEKSIKGLTDFQTVLEEKEVKAASLTKDIRKSITAMSEEDGEVDGAKLLGNIGNALTEVDASNREGQLELAKSIAHLTTGVSSLLDMFKSIQDDQHETSDAVDILKEQNSALLRGIKKAQFGVTSDPKVMKSLNVQGREEEEPANGDILKSMNPRAVDKFLADRGAAEYRGGNITKGQEYFKVQQNFNVQGPTALNKLMRDEIVAHFGNN